jgi:hypothetical protein
MDRRLTKGEQVAFLPNTFCGRLMREEITGTEAAAEVDEEIRFRLGEPARKSSPGVDWTRRYAGDLLSADDLQILLRTAIKRVRLAIAAGSFPESRYFDGRERWSLSLISKLRSRTHTKLERDI